MKERILYDALPLDWQVFGFEWELLLDVALRDAGGRSIYKALESPGFVVAVNDRPWSSRLHVEGRSDHTVRVYLEASDHIDEDEAAAWLTAINHATERLRTPASQVPWAAAIGPVTSGVMKKLATPLQVGPMQLYTSHLAEGGDGPWWAIVVYGETPARSPRLAYNIASEQVRALAALLRGRGPIT